MLSNSLRLMSPLGLENGICQNIQFRKDFARCLFCSSKSWPRKGNEVSLEYKALRFFTKAGPYSLTKGGCGIGLSSRLASTIATIEEKYTNEELQRVLKTVNETNNVEDFKRFLISKKKVDELVKKKSTSGSGALESIDDVISVVGVKNYNRFFCSILDRPSQNVSNPMFPIPSPELVEKMSRVLSVSITAGRVSWCSIRRNAEEGTFVVESIAQKAFLYKPKMHFLTMLSEMTEMAGEVPPSQLCVVEEYPNTVPSPFMFSFQLHMTQMRSAFLSSLAAQSESPKLLSIKSIAVARLFNTYIGSEKVSGQHLVDNMITFKPLPSLIIPEVMKAEYLSADSKIKEGMSNVFLLNLAYWTLTKQFVDSW